MGGRPKLIGIGGEAKRRRMAVGADERREKMEDEEGDGRERSEYKGIEEHGRSD